MKFTEPEEFSMALIDNDTDFYSPELRLYAFHYNDDNAVCAYGIREDLAKQLADMARESGEYWGAFLGAGGEIFDDGDEFILLFWNAEWIPTTKYGKEN